MRSSKLLALIIFGFVSVGGLLAQAAPQDKSLADIARELREKKQAAAAAPATSAPDSQYNYTHEIRATLEREDFAALDQAAQAWRTSRSRFPGGVWRLFVLYEALSAPPAGDDASNSQWLAHLARLQRWVARRPDSITARIALAESHLDYGWNARGEGFANTVTDAGWRVFGEQLQIAAGILKQAAALKAKCPHWYYVMTVLARSQGWPMPATRALLEQAIAFEPAYYHTYREYAYNLLPRWAGKEGDAEAFAEEISSRIGGKEGAFVYFEVASTVNSCCLESHLAAMSWPKIKEGFSAMEELYGVSDLKLNRFAYLAQMANDKATARLLLARPGFDWEPEVWLKKNKFDAFKSWAAE